MAGTPISDEQALERLNAVKKHGSIKAASEALGV